MTPRNRAVAVKQLPETLSVKRARQFFSELESSLNVDRPCLVLDCSKVRALDSSAAHLMLCCLEEAMKRNGDVKLAGISAGANAILELSGLDHLFEAYTTTAEAVSSFRRPPMALAAMAGMGNHSRRPSENAA